MAQKIILMFVILLFSAGAFAQSADAIIGKYKNEQRGDSIVFYKGTDGLYYGKKPSGELLLHKLQYNTGDKTYKGVMIPPGTNFSMEVAITAVDTTSLKMVVTKFFISRTNTLKKIQ